ncbi:MAG: substrate-binding domain-containing protein [Chthoniobacterales bacterium]
MLQILARKNLPDVVLCANDNWATGALKACGDFGIKIPEEIGIVGNDGTIISGYGYIPFTTVTQPLEIMARRVVKLLDALIKMEPLPEHSMKIPGTITWRNSSRIPSSEKSQ